MASNNSTASGPSSGLLISAGLFFTTALASQWLQHRMRSRTKSKAGDYRSKSSMTSQCEGSDDEGIIINKHLHYNNDDESHKEQERHNRVRAQRQRLRRQREILQEYEELERQQQKQQKHPGLWNDTEFHRLENDDVIDSGDDSGGYQEDSEPGLRDPHAEFHDHYRMRRAQNRLSFENLRPLVQEGQVLEGSEKLNLVQGGAVPSKQQPQKQQQKSGPATDVTPLSPEKGHKTKAKPHQRPPRRRHHESVADREDEYDFLPKNSNWNHFERFNEEDLQSGLVVPASGGRHYHHQHHYQPFSHGYIHESSGSVAGTPMDDSVQSHVSNKSAASNNNQQEDGNSSDTSEEPQFVWTEALHEKKRSSLKTTKVSSLASEELIPTEYEQPVVFQRGTRETSIESELPGPNRPVRLSVTESVDTVPTGNTGIDVPPTDFGTPRATNQKARDPRQFLRHENSIGADSSHQEQERLPQRFAHPVPSKSLSRSSSGVSLASTGSEMSRSSSSSHNLSGRRHRKHSSNEPTTKQSRHSARAQYNAKIMPNKVVMIRHGQSMGNIDETLYSTTPDNAMPLTKLGWDQARKAGKHLKDSVLAPLESVHFIVSPYARTVETFHGIVSAWCDPDSPEFASIPNREMRLQAWYGRLLEMGLTWHEDPRIREQDFGNYQVPELIRKAKRDRHRFGIFYYRFPHGESASDVFDRVSTFLDSLWRSFDMNRSRNYVLVTHGISIRVLLARYFRYTIHQFNMLANPQNCEMVVLGHDGLGRLRLQGRYQLHLKDRSEANGNNTSDDKDNADVKKDARILDAAGSDASSVVSKEQIVDEYRFYKRLRILPQAVIRKVDIRISYSEARQMSTSPLPK